MKRTLTVVCFLVAGCSDPELKYLEGRIAGTRDYSERLDGFAAWQKLCQQNGPDWRRAVYLCGTHKAVSTCRTVLAMEAIREQKSTCDRLPP